MKSNVRRSYRTQITAASLLGVICLFTAILGASPSYLIAQISVFSIFILYISTMTQRYVILNTLFLATLFKIFIASQVVKAVLGQPADVGMTSPNETSWAIAAGALGFLAASLALSPLQSAPRATPRAGAISPWAHIETGDLRLIGYTLAAAGLLSRTAASGLADAPVFLFYAGNLAYAGVAALALSNYRETKGTVIFDKITAAIIVLFAALSAAKGSKQLIIAPLIFPILIHIYFSQMPKLSVILLGACAFLFAATALHPAVNYARKISPANPGRGLAMAFEKIGTPGGWREINEQSNGIESNWTNRLYYGRPMGMLNRFTPNQIADVVNVAAYTTVDVKSQISSAITQLLPQTLGFERDNASASSAIESAVRREYNRGDNNANYGLIANFFLLGGLPATFLGMFVIALLIGCVEIAWFSGGRYAFWALPLIPELLFSVADKNIASFLVNFVHGTTISIVLTIILAFTAMSMRGSKSRLRTRSPTLA